MQAQREALALLSRNAPVPAQLLQEVGPPTSDFDPAVSLQAQMALPRFELAPSERVYQSKVGIIAVPGTREA